MLQVWSGIAINSVVIENSSIVGARQTSGVALADGFAGLSQAKNLRKLVLHRQSSIEFPDRDCTIKNLIIGNNTDFLEELSIRLYKIENLEISCPVLNYRFSKGTLPSTLTAILVDLSPFTLNTRTLAPDMRNGNVQKSWNIIDTSSTAVLLRMICRNSAQYRCLSLLFRL
uniref:Uncharacterized protein n=1 Tax=Spironucleus salmonicida TaxID=348837 RepID=V6LIJ8_9EUKA|eukprot:EST44367.1 Hypothetical protein SS50377_15799 [Spironucleus salmonicida]